jgi:hypothetical protein
MESEGPARQVWEPAWEEFGNPGHEAAYLHASVRLLNTRFHVNAIQVDARGRAVSRSHQGELDALTAASDGEPYLTIEIQEKSYVVYLCTGSVRVEQDSMTSAAQS